MPPGMTKQEFMWTMEVLAHEAARKHHERKHPGSTPEQQQAFAEAHWSEERFTLVAADILAICVAVDERDAAAAWN